MGGHASSDHRSWRPNSNLEGETEGRWSQRQEGERARGGKGFGGEASGAESEGKLRILLMARCDIDVLLVSPSVTGLCSILDTKNRIVLWRVDRASLSVSFFPASCVAKKRRALSSRRRKEHAPPRTRAKVQSRGARESECFVRLGGHVLVTACEF